MDKIKLINHYGFNPTEKNRKKISIYNTFLILQEVNLTPCDILFSIKKCNSCYRYILQKKVKTPFKFQKDMHPLETENSLSQMYFITFSLYCALTGFNFSSVNIVIKYEYLLFIKLFFLFL